MKDKTDELMLRQSETAKTQLITKNTQPKRQQLLLSKYKTVQNTCTVK